MLGTVHVHNGKMVLPPKNFGPDPQRDLGSHLPLKALEVRSLRDCLHGTAKLSTGVCIVEQSNVLLSNCPM